MIDGNVQRQHQRGRLTGDAVPSLEPALAEWRALLGEAAVLAGPAAQSRYGAKARQPIAGALRPADSAQVAPILRIANRHGVPLHPVSIGRNWGYGDARPAGAGVVVLDLSRLDRILHIDAALGTVTLEPGVTQGQLRRELDRLGLALMVPTTGAGPEASLVGNALERGYGVTPHADHFAAVTSLKAVLPDGTPYASRLSALAGDRLDACHKWGIGPYLDGLFTQASYGVVTEMTIALAHRPPHVEAFYIFLRREDQLVPAIRALHGVLRTVGGMLGSVNVLNGYRLASMSCDYPADLLAAGAGPLQPDRLAAMLKTGHMAPYMVMGSVYGERGTARAALAAVRRAFSVCDARIVTMTRGKAEALVRLAQRFPRLAAGLGFTHAWRLLRALNIIEGIPDDFALRLVHWKSRDPLPRDMSAAMQAAAHDLLWYSPLVPMDPAAVVAFEAMVKRTCLSHGFEPLVTLTTLSDRCFDSSVPILFDHRRPGARQRAEDCYKALLHRGRALGVYPYRVGVDAYPLLSSTDDPGLDLARRIKNLLDPKGVLSPGRYNL
jgi:4-cresol dehydrogenase (hydroxylating)